MKFPVASCQFPVASFHLSEEEVGSLATDLAATPAFDRSGFRGRTETPGNGGLSVRISSQFPASAEQVP
jgi:hypothetical protein